MKCLKTVSDQEMNLLLDEIAEKHPECRQSAEECKASFIALAQAENESLLLAQEAKAAPAIDVTKPQPLAPWTDADLDAMTADFTPDDVKESLALRTSEMREILEANQDE